MYVSNPAAVCSTEPPNGLKGLGCRGATASEVNARTRSRAARGGDPVLELVELVA